MDENNVISFPKMKLDSPVQSPEELAQKLREYKTSFADDISEFLWNHVLTEMVRAGCRFDSDSEKYYPSIILLLESIRSLYLEAQGIDHPLQEFAAEFVDLDDEEEMIDNFEEE
jgi:hypothetical protein